MSENKNTLAKGMFVREHTFNSGTKVIKLSINPIDFCQFMKENMSDDVNGNKRVAITLWPVKEIKDNGLSHTPVLNEYMRKTAEQAINDLATEALTPSAEERAITETPTKKTRKKASKKVTADDLPF